MPVRQRAKIQEVLLQLSLTPKDPRHAPDLQLDAGVNVRPDRVYVVVRRRFAAAPCLLVKVEVVRAKLLEQKFKLYFRVDNRDDADLTVRGLIYKVTPTTLCSPKASPTNGSPYLLAAMGFSRYRCAPTSGRRYGMWCRC